MSLILKAFLQRSGSFRGRKKFIIAAFSAALILLSSALILLKKFADAAASAIAFVPVSVVAFAKRGGRGEAASKLSSVGKRLATLSCPLSNQSLEKRRRRKGGTKIPVRRWGCFIWGKSRREREKACLCSLSERAGL